MYVCLRLDVLHVLSLHLTNQILPPTLSANHVSAVSHLCPLLHSVLLLLFIQ